MHKMNFVVRQLAGCAILALAIGATPALAQNASASESAESAAGDGAIIVTARKRDERLLDVPVSIQALTAPTLARYGTNSLTDIGKLATQVQLFPSSAGAGAVFAIRGISSSSLDPGVDTSVSINIDGMGISRGRVVREATFDLDTVEVLKGPQALFFGKNSPAGVITMRSADPTKTWQFKARGYYEGNDREFIGEAVASGPLSDALGVRLAYQGSTASGWLHNVAPARGPTASDPFTLPGALDNRLGGYKQHMGRLTLLYNPDDKLKVRFKVLGSTYRGDAGAAMLQVTHCAGQFPVSQGVADTAGDCVADDRTSVGAAPAEFLGHYYGLQGRSNTGFFNNYDSVISSLEINYNMGNLNLTSLTGLHYYKSAQFDTFDSTQIAINSGYQDEKNTNISQEVRLASTFETPLNFMLGGYFEHYKRDYSGAGTLVRLNIPAFGIFYQDPATGRYDQWQTATSSHGNTFSIFGQLTLRFAENFELAGGARYTHETKHETATTIYTDFPTLGPAGTSIPGLDISENNWSPEATLRWKPQPNLMFYAAYKTGYKSGGFSAQTYYARPDTAANLIFKPERSFGFEGGFKGSFDDNRMHLSITGYRYTFRNIQDTVFDAVARRAAVFNADARVQGFEVDADYRPTPDLQLRAQAGYNDSHYLNFPNAPCFAGQTAAQGCVVNNTGLGGPTNVQNISGRRRPFAPELTFGIGATVDVPLNDSYKFSLSADGNYTSSYITQVPDAPFSAQPAYMTLDAAVRFGPTNQSWTLGLIGKNLTNKYVVAATNDKPSGATGDINGIVIRARQVAFEVTAKF